MRGLLECGRAMRMDGTFVGQLKSTGSITIGPTGQVTGDLKGLKFLRVEGLVREDGRPIPFWLFRWVPVCASPLHPSGHRCCFPVLIDGPGSSACAVATLGAVLGWG